MARKRLDALHIQNFRAFGDLDIPHLGHINLIVGMNNVGKTSLLEAVRLYANRGTLESAWDILEERGEIEPELRERTTTRDVEQRVEALRYLFHKYPKYPMNNRPSKSDGGRIEIRGGNSESIRVGVTDIRTDHQDTLSDQLDLRVPVWALDFGNETRQVLYPLERDLTGMVNPSLPLIPCQFVPSRGITEGEMARLWDDVDLTSKESEVIDALRLVDKRIENISFREGRKRRDRRIPFVKLNRDVISPIPLRSLGEGVVRILGLSLALVNAEHGVFLMDEIDSGFHYSVMEKMWNTVAHLADRFNVQVFATTHSNDCLQAFEVVMPQNDAIEGMAISLRAKHNDATTIIPIIIKEEELQKVVDYGVEVR